MDAIDLNSDLGEGYGAYRLGHDAELMKVISSANVACGFHAGDPRTMRDSARLAREHAVGVGAHPGFPDRVGFGRRVLHAGPEEITTDVLYQIGALAAFCRAEGLRLQHVKPHGALYNMAARDATVAAAIVDAVARYDAGLFVFAPPHSALEEAAQGSGVLVAREIFADRAYERDGSLTPRSVPGAVVTETQEVIARTIRMIREGTVVARTGEEIAMSGQTICVHGDTADAAALLRDLRTALEAGGIRVRPVGSLHAS
jgi:UPF0271 protein